MNKNKFLLSILVHNESGVLTRVSGLFARRGYNIESLSVGETEKPDISRITVVAVGGDYERDQIIKQLQKLHDVLILEEMDETAVVSRELMLIKVNISQGKRSEVLEAVSVFRAKVVDLTPLSLTVEITGEQSKCDAFLEYLKPFGVAELTRTGVTAIGRGQDILLKKKKSEE